MIVANLSGGRDSSCMVVKWLELGNKLDHIIFCDTGYEFPEMYEYVDKLENYIQKEFNMSFTRLDNTDKIEKWAFEYPITRGENEGQLRGLPRTIGKEFCTRETKVRPTERFVLEKSPNKFKNTALIGYTYNEVENGRTTNLAYATAKYPLHEWNMNEPEVDEFLGKRGIHNKLYNHFGRTGCFFCPKQRLASYYALWKHYPKQWAIMKQWEQRAKNLGCRNDRWHREYYMDTLEKRFSSQSQSLFDDESEKLDYGQTCFCHK